MQKTAGTIAHRLLLLAAFGGVLALHLAMASRMRVPMLFADETTYLGMARYLAGDAPDLRLANPTYPASAFMAVGYPLLLLPAVALAGSPSGAYRAALVINSLFAAGAFALLFAYARRVLALSQGRAIAAALAASFYPALLLQSNLAWSESLLFLLLPALVLAFLRLAETRSMAAALLFAALTACTYQAHQRTLGLIPLGLAALWLLHRRSGLPRSAAAAGAGAMVLLVLTARGANAWVWERLCADGSRYGEAQIFARLAQPEGLLEAFRSVVGQLWYLTAATAGTALLGVWLLARMARMAAQSPPSESARRWTAGFTLACWAALFLTSSVFMIVPDRADKLIYGRYWEPALSLLLVAAVACLWECPARRRAFIPFAITALAPVGLGLVLVSLREGSAFQQAFNHLTVLGIAHWVVLLGSLRILWITAISAAAGLTLLGLALRRPTAAAWALALFFLAGGLYTFQTWMVPSNRFTESNIRIPMEVAQIPGATAVAYDEGHPSPSGFFAYPFWLDRVRLLWFDSRNGQLPPAELVISARDWHPPVASARIAYPENFNDQALWVLPGKLQDRLAAAGALLPADPAAPIPDEACRSRIELLADPGRDLRIEQSASRTLRLRLTHRGSGAPWVSTAALGTPEQAVRIGVQWYRKDVFAADRRAELPYTLAPGDHADLDLVLDPNVSPGQPLSPGSYEVRIGLLQEIVRWCRDVGDGELRLEVEVVEEGFLGRLLSR